MKEILQTLIDRQSLHKKQMHQFMQAVMDGSIDDVMMAAILVALQSKGETPEEITVAAQVMRDLARPISTPPLNSVDIVGTGGDGQHTFNISTASAFVAASCGVTIIKHGNRSASSHCGSADLLEAAGVNLMISPEKINTYVEACNIAFLFAPNYHPALKNAKKVRSLLGIKTLFNLLGPLTNPAQTKRQVVGVFHKKWLQPVAKALQLLGSEHAMVVHSADGMDEISLFDKTYVSELKDGKVTDYELNPKEYGFDVGSINDIVTHSIDDSLALFNKVLHNQHPEACSIVILNAAAAIYCSGLANSYESAIQQASDAINAQKALHCFETYKQKTQSLC